MLRPTLALAAVMATVLPAAAHTTGAPHVHAEPAGFAVLLAGLLVITLAATIALRTARSRT